MPADVPGFIVNHVARPYYLEAFRILEDGYASPDVIDGAMKELGGFRMGPLELTEFIGQDVNRLITAIIIHTSPRLPTQTSISNKFLLQRVRCKQHWSIPGRWM